MKKPQRGWFIAGTDTDVGKTYVACRMLRELRMRGERVGAYKPAASGAVSREASDAYQLWIAQGQTVSEDLVNPQSFVAPLAPPVAAEIENRQVDEGLLLYGIERWHDHCDILLVEGAGGLMSPISWNMTNADLAKAIGYPLVVVARNKLGVVHQVLAACEAAVAKGLNVNEIVLNDVSREADDAGNSNERLLAPFLAKILPGVSIRREAFGNETGSGDQA
jgi:dethiobiotin synthetase